MPNKNNNAKTTMISNKDASKESRLVEEFRQEIYHILKSSKTVPITTENTILQETWTKFSAKHGISPVSINNNIQSKEGVTKNGADKRKYGEFPSTTPKVPQNNTNILRSVLKTTIWSMRLFYKAFKILGACILTLFVLYCIFILHKPTQRFISRNTQDLIYPLMRALRLMSIPVVRRFPFLTGNNSHLHMFN